MDAKVTQNIRALAECEMKFSSNGCISVAESQ